MFVVGMLILHILCLYIYAARISVYEYTINVPYSASLLILFALVT